MRKPTMVVGDRRIFALGTLVPLMAAAALGIGVRPAYADTACVVNSLADTDGTGASCQTTANNGTVTLRSAFHRHVTAGGTNTITFAGSLALPGTITFGSPLTLGGGTLTITGPGARRLTLDGGGSVRLFVINSGTLNLSGLTIEHGNSTGQGPAWGGAIYEPGSGILAMDRMTFAHNQSPSFGGAVWNSPSSSVTVTDSTFTQNTAAAGGGAESGSNVTLTNVTATGNTGGWGGAFHADHAIVTIVNSTIYANTATNAGINGGGTYGSDTVHLKNTIVAANKVNSTPNNCAGNVTANTVDDGYNLDSGTTCNFSNHALNSTDPLLNGLANNGGPTDTMSEKSNSPAVDSAGPGCPATDQRGAARNTDGHCDRGAFEFAPVAVSAVSAANVNNCVPAGTAVTITGTGFSLATAVNFGSTPATSFTVNSDSQITAVAPSGSGVVDITVTNTDGTSATVTSDQVTLGTCAVPGLPAAGHPTGSGTPVPWPALPGSGLMALSGAYLWRRRSLGRS